MMARQLLLKKEKRMFTTNAFVFILALLVVLGSVVINPESYFVATTTAFVVVPYASKKTLALPRSSPHILAGGKIDADHHNQLPSIFSATDNKNAVARPSASTRGNGGGGDGGGNDLRRCLLSAILTVTIATTSCALGGFPLPASAEFGPSSGATTTPPPNLNKILTTAAKAKGSVENNGFSLDLDGKKLKILIDSALSNSRLEEFSSQLDELIENLSLDTFGSSDDTPARDDKKPYIVAKKERQEELRKAQNLQKQIQQQEKTLAKLQNQPYWFNYFAAFVGSTVSTLVMHPVDTIKTRLQAKSNDDDEQERDDEEEEGATYNEKNDDMISEVNMLLPSLTRRQPSYPHPSGNKNEHGTVVCEPVDVVSAPKSSTTLMMGLAVSKTTPATNAVASRQGSGGGLYEGLTGNLFKEAPPSAVYLGVYETVKYALSPKVDPSLLLLVYLVAGAAGETVGSVIRAPAEAVKSLVQTKSKDSAFQAAKSVFGTPEGRLNVLRAWSASVIRDVPFGAIQLAAFEMIKAFILNNPNIEFDPSTTSSEAIIGAFAGGLGAFVTNPADVITTRIITQDTTGGDGEDCNGAVDVKDALAASSSGGTEPLGVLGMTQKIYNEGGFNAFWKGWVARVGFWAPAISIFLTCYCSVRKAAITNDIFP